MIPVALRDIPARLVHGTHQATISAVVADSREAVPGSLFVALRGSRADGHDFLEQACRNGAVAALCEAGRGTPVEGLAVFEARDPLAALGRLANRVRRSSSATVVGIVGAAGKTSTKDILRALCAPHSTTVASHASYNNELGVPLTLCRLEAETRVAVCELGTGGLGEIAGLCRTAEPDVGLVTCLGPEHLESFGTLTNAVRGEAELIDALAAGAPLVFPFGEPLLASHRRPALPEISFGRSPDADVRPLRWLPGRTATDVVLSIHGSRIALRTNLRAPHQALNLCGAAAAYVALGLPLSEVGEGAERIALSPWRDQERVLSGGCVLVNDAYNANPVSMAAALEGLAARRNGGRLVAVLGEMGELGPGARTWHRRVGELAAAYRIDLLMAVGPLARGYCEGTAGRLATRWVPDVESAASTLPDLLEPDDVVLLKGSRSVGLEQLEAALL